MYVSAFTGDTPARIKADQKKGSKNQKDARQKDQPQRFFEKQDADQ